MRPFKFRCWVPNQQKMLVGCDIVGSEARWGALSLRGCPLMQFTGLHDKNGKEIYEGDLIECYTKNDGEKIYTYPHKVKLPDFYREIWSENKYGLPADEGQKTKVLVVGNMYENPELLK